MPNSCPKNTTEVLKNYYDKYWESKIPFDKPYTDPHSPLYVDKRLRLAQEYTSIRKLSQGVVLDLGCGPRVYLGKFHGDNLNIGIDISFRVLSGIKNYSSQVRLINAAAENIPLKDFSADIIFCMHIMEHVVDEQAVLAEMKRVLKPNGCILFQIPNGYSAFYCPKRITRIFLAKISGKKYSEGETLYDCIGKEAHLRRYSLKKILRLLRENGFRVKKARGIFIDNAGRFPQAFDALIRNKVVFSLFSLLSALFPTLGAEFTVLVQTKHENNS